jgi:hypothetical protein
MVMGKKSFIKRHASHIFTSVHPYSTRTTDTKCTCGTHVDEGMHM